jgi:hypothetical protein
LNLHCDWLVRVLVLGQKLGQIAATVDGEKSIDDQAVGKAVREVAVLVGVTWKERRGRKKSNL